MKALILKDVYVLWKQMRIFLLAILVMAAINSTFNAVFLVVWSSMLPYTAIAYDERSHWDQFAAMMPYRRKDIVLSKYVLGWLCMASAAVICLVMQLSIGLFSTHVTSIPTLLISLGVGVVCLDITLPIILRFGVERGRMIFMLIIFGTTVGVGIMVEALETLPPLSLPFLGTVLAAAAVILTILSIPLSMKLYKAS